MHYYAEGILGKTIGKGYANYRIYSFIQMINCETSTLLITRKGTNNVSADTLLKIDGKWYITLPFSFLFKNAFNYETALCADCLVHPKLDEACWLLFNMDGSVAERVVFLNGKLPEATMEAGYIDGKN